MRGIRGLASLALAAAPLALSAAQPMDPEFAQHVREWTTKPEFSSPLVDHLPASATIPSPRQVLGHDVGAPGKLDYYADLLKYYRALAANSPRVKILEIGKTEEGRDNIVVMLSAADNIRDLEANRQNLGRLADPRGLAPTQAQELIARTKPIYHLMGALHSSETGPAEMLLELAYRVVTEESPLRTSESSACCTTRCSTTRTCNDGAARGRAGEAQLELDRVFQMVTDAATELSGAAFGAFFYNVIDEKKESYWLPVSPAPSAAQSQTTLRRRRRNPTTERGASELARAAYLGTLAT